jgi:hypothetical protein
MEKFTITIDYTERCYPSVLFPENDEPAIFWWKDMRPKEVRDDFIKIFKKGVKLGQQYPNEEIKFEIEER